MLDVHDDGVSEITVEAGIRYFECRFARPIAPKDVRAGLARLGLGRLRDAAGEIELGGDLPFRGVADLPAMRVKARGPVAWSRVTPIGFDPYEAPDLEHVKVSAAELEPDVRYECKLLSRVKLHPTREDVLRELRSMGWKRLRLIETSQSRSSGLKLAVWYARAVWAGPKSVLTGQEPVFFQHALRVSD